MTTDTEILESQSQPGWLFPYLLAADIARIDITTLSRKERKAANIAPTAPGVFNGWGRWAWWLWFTQEFESMPQAPIPQVPFASSPHGQDVKAVQEWLRYPVRRHFSWYAEAWLMLVRWLLFGFGYTELGVEREVGHIPDDVKIQWYKQVHIINLLHSPVDWSAFVLQGGLPDDKSTGSPWKRSTGFFSTPLDACSVMMRLTMPDDSSPLIDWRVRSFYDPCVGSGSMLLLASNKSLLLYGQDIVADLVLCTLLNGFLWIPWLVYMPEHTKAMIEAHAHELDRLRTMRDVLMYPNTTPDNGNSHHIPSVGVIVGDSLETRTLAQERRESAMQFEEAVRAGRLEQGSLF